MPRGGARAEVVAGHGDAPKIAGKFEDSRKKDRDVAAMARMMKIKREAMRNRPARENTADQLRSAVLRKISGRS